MNGAVQVAGHPGGIALLGDGKYILKATTVHEADFYEQVKQAARAAGDDAPLARLLRLMPACEGIHTAQEPALDEDEDNGKDKVKIVIENLVHGYTRPCVLDIKLGSQLWDERASEEKRARMDQAARSTTSWTDGIRLTGWQVWDADAQRNVSVSKTFGKAIGPDSLAVGMRLFFGAASQSDCESFAAVVRAAEEEPPTVRPSTVQKAEAAALLKNHILPQCIAVQEAMNGVEVRIRGGSLLIVYEGDHEQLRDRAPMVRLIDFAHSRLAPGEGPDEGVLKGLSTVTSLLQDLIQQVESNA